MKFDFQVFRTEAIVLKFIDIPKFLTNRANYKIDVGFKYFADTIKNFVEEDGLILNPEFQRGHVWTEKQQSAYIEYVLKEGTSGKDIYFNKPSWHCKAQILFVLMDCNVLRQFVNF